MKSNEKVFHSKRQLPAKGAAERAAKTGPKKADAGRLLHERDERCKLYPIGKQDEPCTRGMVGPVHTHSGAWKVRLKTEAGSKTRTPARVGIADSNKIENIDRIPLYAMLLRQNCDPASRPNI